MSEMRLNWGSAFDKYDGWIASDIDDYGQGLPLGGHCGDILDGLPWGENTFDVVVTHHALQMIKYVDMDWVFGELHRVLKPGGVLRVSVPDVRRAYQALLENDAAWFPVADAVQPSIEGKFSAYVTWYSEARSAFTRGYLSHLLDPLFSKHAFVGYTGTVFGKPEWAALDKRPNESIFVEAVK